jgi:hypothetical protein
LNLRGAQGFEPVNHFLPGVVEGRWSDQLIEHIPKILSEGVVGYEAKIIGIRKEPLQPAPVRCRTIEEFECGEECDGRGEA